MDMHKKISIYSLALRRFRLWRFRKSLEKAHLNRYRRVLLCWNRGLGDIPLGIHPLLQLLKARLPHASFDILTRADLVQGFQLLKGVDRIFSSSWKRGHPYDVGHTLRCLNVSSEEFDWIIDRPNPTLWCQAFHPLSEPKLEWNTSWDSFTLPDLQGIKDGIGIHFQTETVYSYEKNWPLEAWQELFSHFKKQKRAVLLFGHAAHPQVDQEGIIDLRGKTSLQMLIAIIKNHCSHLVAPDSGILTILYYLNCCFPLKVVSLWADPNQGILKWGAPSPNSFLRHTPLIGKEGDIRHIHLESVLCALNS
jgi:ADP-heptose:LPS heptosyltransferase